MFEILRDQVRLTTQSIKLDCLPASMSSVGSDAM